MANFEIQCPIKLHISNETADLCAKVLEMYIQDTDKVVATMMRPEPEGIKKYVRILDEIDGEYEEAGEREEVNPMDRVKVPRMPAGKDCEKELAEYKRKWKNAASTEFRPEDVVSKDELQAQPENKEETEEIGWQLSKLEQ